LQLDGTALPKGSIPYSTWIKIDPTIKDLKIRTALVEGKGYKFKIGICDRNNNGIFSEKNKDIISVNVFDSNNMYLTNSISCGKLEGENIIEFNGLFFKTISIDSFGNYIKIRKIKSKSSNFEQLKVIDRVPNILLEKINGTYSNFQDFLKEKKYIYVEFWATWCPPCVEGIDELNNVVIARSDLLVILLNANEEKEAIKDFLHRFNPQCIQALSNPQIEKHLHQNGYPYGVLFDKSGKPILFGVDPKNLLNTLTLYEKK
jgi:thiol-disulfide isomerase/thioredoxin